MATLTTEQVKDLIVRTRARFREIDHADWNGRSYRTADTAKWEQAARECAPPEWVEYVRILAQGWDYYGGSDLPGDPTTSAQGRA
jgi:broad specificity phosphatase PhoE